MNQLLSDLGVKDSTPCGECQDSLEEADQWVMITRPSGDGEHLTTTIFCSMACWFRFCERMILVVAAVRKSASASTPH